MARTWPSQEKSNTTSLVGLDWSHHCVGCGPFWNWQTKPVQLSRWGQRSRAVP
jgi:hypothetical protein